MFSIHYGASKEEQELAIGSAKVTADSLADPE